VHRQKTTKPAADLAKPKRTSAAAKANPPAPPPSRVRATPDPTFPISVAEDRDEFSAPPLAGKVHPREAMDEMVPTLDDSDRLFRHHPNDQVSEGFSFDPESADAAADLAGDLGAEFLEGATEGRDMSDVIFSDDRNDEDTYIVEDYSEEGEEIEETYMAEDEVAKVEQNAASDNRLDVSEGSRKRARRMR